MTMIGQFDADVQAIEPELPVSFVWQGKTLTGSRNATSDSQALADAGIIQMYDVDLIVRTALFVGIPVPAKNDEIKIQNRDLAWVFYRIEKITDAQDGVTMTLHCVQQN
jgi:hypothetical protein